MPTDPIPIWDEGSKTCTFYGTLNAPFDTFGIDKGLAVASETTLVIGDTGQLSNTALLRNEGLIINNGNFYNDGFIGNFNSIRNHGTLTNEARIENAAVLSNSGIINNDGGFIDNYGRFTNFETATITSTGHISTNDFGLFDNSGFLENLGLIDNFAQMNNFAKLINRGTINNDGAFRNFDELLNRNGGTITNSALSDYHSHYIKNFGLIENAGTINNDSSFENSGILKSNCGTFIDAGTFIGNSIIDICDTDGDGIVDIVDTQPSSFSSDFSDIGIGGATTGRITSRGDQALTILDAPNPDGVEIKADPLGGGDRARVSACGGSATYNIAAGRDIIVTCGSVKTQVIQGPVQADLFGSNGFTATLEISTGYTVTFDQVTNSVTSASGNPGSITYTTGGNTVTVDPGETVQQLSVRVDIKPDGIPNTINLKKDKIVTVALLGSSSFDVNSVNKSTLKFGGATLQPPVKTTSQDVNKDSIMDLVSQFNVPPLGFTVADTQGCLTGVTQNGAPFMGCDSVRILNK